MGEAQELYEQIARMQAYEMSLAQMADALGLAIEQVERLIACPEYQQVAARIAAERFEQQELMNRGWDSVEAQALTIVNNTLAWSKDPEYALKAAAVANKAQRRGAGNAPLQAPAGARVVITLNNNYVNRLNAVHTGSELVQAKILPFPQTAETPKIQNALAIDAVRDLMQTPTKMEDFFDSLGRLEE